MSDKTGIITVFSRHKVAANLLMALMMLSGLWALTRLNIQFLPTFSVNTINVVVAWPGASAEDIEKSITNPIERELRSTDELKEMTSTSKLGSVQIGLEFEQGADLGRALEDVRERVSRVRNLPPDSEKPVITKVIPYESVARFIISGPKRLEELRPLIHRFERELLDRGIAKVTIIGLPDQELAIQVPTQKLAELKLSLPQLAQRINSRSQDFPAGTIGKSEVGRQLRSLEQRRSIIAFENLPVIHEANGQLLLVKDIADVSLRPQENEVEVSYQGKPAIEMRLLRAENANSLKSARIIYQWLADTQPQLGESIKIKIIDERWQLIKERINLLVKNGLGGLLLILGILFLMLDRRVAFWTSMGIPASFLASLTVLYFYGGSINMVSLFAFIMTLGIIVDDTIVVGEQTLTNLQYGDEIHLASEAAAYKMLAPIMSSSLTTVAAFLPLILIGGVIGTILKTIPIVVICVLIASLIECFFVLPGHLNHSFKGFDRYQPKTGIHHYTDLKFHIFKTKYFRRFVKYALHYRGITMSCCAAVFILTIALLAGGYVNFTFFPTPDGNTLRANVQFIVGTPPPQVRQFMNTMEKALYKTNEQLQQKNQDKILVSGHVIYNRADVNNYQINSGEQFASMTVELTPADSRKTNNQQFINAWKANINIPTSVENFSIFTPRGGPPGEDIDIEFDGTDPVKLKEAAIELKTRLGGFAGVSDINDDLPFGQEQLVFAVNATGKSVGLTINDVGRQIRAAFNGEIVQIYHEPNEEVEVRVILPNKERNNTATLEHYPVVTPGRKVVPLGTVVDLSYKRGPDTLLHTDTKLTVHVRAKVDNEVNNANRILAELQQQYLPDLANKYGFGIRYKGKAEEQAETLTDMKYGLLLGLTLIYIILAWVFSSYGWPLVVMAVIPLGVCGAIFGHWVMGLDITLLSLFGLFGLSGIVINDSIILLNEYRMLRERGTPRRPAIIEASCLRLRAVLLTSLTTIAGLIPLLFETSRQAQFLIPMAVSITFGLAFATLMILVVVPTLLSLYEDLLRTLRG